MIALIVILVIIVVIALGAVASYNRFVSQRNAVQNAWADIDTELKRRYDLIPNLVSTVQGYAAHERGGFEEFAQARSVNSPSVSSSRSCASSVASAKPPGRRPSPRLISVVTDSIRLARIILESVVR